MADGTTETITQSGADAFTKPFLQYGMSEALRQYQAGAPQFYQGQTYAGFTPQTEQALRMQEQRALAGSPLVQQGQATLGSFLGSTGAQGQYVPPAQSGLLTGAIQRALDPVQARVESQLAQRGRLGSGAAADYMTRALGDVAANVAYRDFDTQRRLGLQAAQLAPSMAAADYSDISRLQQVGAAREAQAERGIQEAMQRYQYEQNAPMTQLAQYQNLIAGFPQGTTSTQITPYYEPSTGQKFLGGAAALAGALGDGSSPQERREAALYGGLLGLF
jgi:hypothetical protein